MYKELHQRFLDRNVSCCEHIFTCVVVFAVVLVGLSTLVGRIAFDVIVVLLFADFPIELVLFDVVVVVFK